MQVENLTRSRGKEIGSLLAANAAEDFSKSGFLRLSSINSRIVEDSRHKGDYYEIEEIGLVDRKGKLVAHNSVAKMAKGAPPSFTEKRYKEVLRLPREGDMAFQTLERVNLENRYSHYLKGDDRPRKILRRGFHYLQNRIFPWLKNIGRRYHIGYPVYRYPVTDMTPIASARLHIIISVRSMDVLIQNYEDLFVSLLKIVPVVSAGITFLIWLFFLLPLSRKRLRKKRNYYEEMQRARDEESFSLFGDDELQQAGVDIFPAAEVAEFELPEETESRPIFGGREKKEDARTRILDAIPID